MRFILLTLAVASLQSTAHAAPALNAVFKCPVRGPHRACIEVTLLREGAEGRDGVFPYIELPSKGPQFMRLWGRIDGGPQTEFMLKLDWEQAWRPDDGAAFPGIAYLGRSPENNPIILTDRGKFEITTAGIDLALSDFYLIDARRWKVVTRLFSPDRGEYIFTSATKIGVWDDARKLCISAPMSEPGLLRITPENCAARPAPAAKIEPRLPSTPQDGFRSIVQTLIGIDPKPNLTPSEEEQEITWAQEQAARGLTMGNLVPERTTLRHIRRALPDAPNEEMGDIDRVWTRWGGMGVGIDVFRIKGSNILVVEYSNDPC